MALAGPQTWRLTAASRRDHHLGLNVPRLEHELEAVHVAVDGSYDALYGLWVPQAESNR